jgi:hypothetical protein
MSRIPFSSTGPEANFDKQWAFEIAYFTQHIGTDLRKLGDFLNARDYVESCLLVSEMKQRAEYEKNSSARLQDFRWSCKGPQAV